MFGKRLFPTANKKQLPVLTYGTICSNAGFMGMPLSESIYGSTGLLFASIYCILQRIVMWSAGVFCFTEAKGKDVIKKSHHTPLYYCMCARDDHYDITNSFTHFSY